MWHLSRMRDGERPSLILSSSSRHPHSANIEGTAEPYKKPKPRGCTSGVSGAATRIRTGDLILTKDVLYQLSHSSASALIGFCPY